MRKVNVIVQIEIPDEGDELFLIQSLMDVTRPEEREIYLDGTLQKTGKMTIRFDKWEFADQPQGA